MMTSLLAEMQRLRQHDRWTQAELEQHSADGLARLRAYASTHSPFSRQFHAGLMHCRLHELPVLTNISAEC